MTADDIRSDDFYQKIEMKIKKYLDKHQNTILLDGK